MIAYMVKRYDEVPVCVDELVISGVCLFPSWRTMRLLEQRDSASTHFNR